MARRYFSERQRVSQPRIVETISEGAKASLTAYVQMYVFNSAEDFVNAIRCGPCNGSYAANVYEIEQSIVTGIGKIYDLELDGVFSSDENSDTFDLIEIYYDEVVRAYNEIMVYCLLLPRHGSRRITCPVKNKLNEFTDGINRVLEREKVAYELNIDGQIVRIGAPVLSDVIQSSAFATGDNELDGLLETAQDKFISRNPAMRREGLEKLWDAWERLKTVEPGSDKKASTSALLDRVVDGPMRDRLEREAIELTDIGNKFMIRHSEVGKHPLTDDRHVDYLFPRLFSLVYLLLDGTGRVGASK